MPDIRQFVLFDRETRTEASAPVSKPTRQVAVAAVFANPYAGKGPANAAALEALAALSFDIGTELTARALQIGRAHV